MASLQWLDRPVLSDPVAVLAFEGWGDAGEAASQAVQTLLDDLGGDLVATIDPDEHFDFQVRRPLVALDESGVRSITWPRNEIHAISTPDQDVVLVLGEEPHYRWKVFTTELADALRALGVRRAITIGAFIGQVAHTLPVPLVGSAAKPDTLTLHGLLPSGYEGPTGIVGVLNHALANVGIDVISVWAAVPHYLSNQDYPPATEALVTKTVELIGLRFDVGELSQLSRQFLDTVDQALEGNSDLRRYVERLEEEADSEPDRAVRLVEEIEDFLRDHD